LPAQILLDVGSGGKECQAAPGGSSTLEEADKDAIIAQLRSQLVAAENLVRTANAAALSSSLHLESKAGAGASAAPAVHKDVADALNAINSRLKVVSDRLDVLLQS
jgi:ABC-type hemin transport system substrate-binding protein